MRTTLQPFLPPSWLAMHSSWPSWLNLRDDIGVRRLEIDLTSFGCRSGSEGSSEDENADAAEYMSTYPELVLWPKD